MAASKRRARKPSQTLSVAQLEVAAQFSDYAFDCPNLAFDEVARTALGVRAFPGTAMGRKFRQEATAVFDQERRK